MTTQEQPHIERVIIESNHIVILHTGWEHIELTIITVKA